VMQTDLPPVGLSRAYRLKLHNRSWMKRRRRATIQQPWRKTKEVRLRMQIKDGQLESR
jgi:hypothetical protein